jgi:hypothetical protein
VLRGAVQVHRSRDTIMILARSCTHPEAPLDPERERGTIFYSGYHFKTIRTPEGSPATIVTGLVKQVVHTHTWGCGG